MNKTFGFRGRKETQDLTPCSSVAKDSPLNASAEPDVIACLRNARLETFVVIMPLPFVVLIGNYIFIYSLTNETRVIKGFVVSQVKESPSISFLRPHCPILAKTRNSQPEKQTAESVVYKNSSELKFVENVALQAIGFLN